MTAADAYEGYLKLVPEGVELRNEIAARIAMRVLTYRPGRLAAKVRCPILFCVCQTDSVAPAGPTLRYAARAPRGEVKLYPEGISPSTSTTRSSAPSPTRSRSWTSI